MSTLRTAFGAAGESADVIPLYKPHLPPGSAAVIQKVLESGQISGDGRLPEFEEGFRRIIEAPRVAATGEFSRTVEMALRMAGVGPGDGVLISPLACLASAMPLLQAGARPIWCDIDVTTGSIDPEEIRRRQSAGAKAVLLYHWVGVPGDIAHVQRVAAQSSLKVVEDAGESLGASYAGHPIGSHGCDYSVFSFSPARHLTTGEGAAIVCNDAAEDGRARLWRRYGIPEVGFRDAQGELSPVCEITVPGTHNYMNRIAGALGVLQLETLPALLARHRSNGEFFDQRLADVPGLHLLNRDNGRIPSHWVYCFRCERRDDLRSKLRAAGIYASTVHIRTDIYSCFGTGRVDLPAIEQFERTQLCIPSGWWVTDENREYIAETIRAGW